MADDFNPLSWAQMPMGARYVGRDAWGMPVYEDAMGRRFTASFGEAPAPEEDEPAPGAVAANQTRTGRMGSTERPDPEGRADAISGTLPAAAMGIAEGMWDTISMPARAARGEALTNEDMASFAADFGMLGMGGAAAGMVPEDAVGIFAGRNARTADYDMLVQAERLEQRGTSPEGIWMTTGWGRGTDGQWRFEIPDNLTSMRFNMRPGDQGPMDNYLTHSKLYAAYPQLRDVPFSVGTQAGYLGAFTPYPPGQRNATGIPGQISVSPEGPDRGFRDVHSTALHEAQHAVQAIEGFAPGSNPTLQRVEPGTPLWEVREQYLQGLRDQPPTLEEFIARRLETMPDNIAAAMRPEHWEQQYQSALARWRRSDFLPTDLSAAERFAQRQGYERQAGEVEARATQARMNLTKADRRNMPPWLHGEDVARERQLVTPPDLTSGFDQPQGALDPRYGLGGDLLRLDPHYQGPSGRPNNLRLPGRPDPVSALPIGPLQDAAQSYMAGRGLEHPALDAYPPHNPERARLIGAAYDMMPTAPQDPRVARSYDAMIQETLDQYRALEGTGLDISFMREGMKDPYALSPALGYQDIVENGHLWTFPTDFGFGSNAAFDPSENPLLVGVGRIGDKADATANDAFRVVHDAFGHFGPGNPFFRHQGEERAWLEHSRMYSPDARPAMTSETRGQNSWLNFGPYGEQNRSALGADTHFADQKAVAMPEWATRPDGLPDDDELGELTRFIARQWTGR